jgi:arabinogalactan endo-1,4-beta-galactosidase
MARTAKNSRMEVWVEDYEDFIPNKSNRQQRRAKRHKTKEKFKKILHDYDTESLKTLDFEDFLDQE